MLSIDSFDMLVRPDLKFYLLIRESWWPLVMFWFELDLELALGPELLEKAVPL